jgi:hypothetical protein
MKSVKIISTNGVDRATVEFTHDDGSKSTTENLGPLPVSDPEALLEALEAYEQAYVAGLAQVRASSPVADGTVLTPAPDFTQA